MEREVEKEGKTMSISKAAAFKKIRPVVEEIVEQKLMELLGDPDSGLELRKAVERRLKHSLKRKVKGIPAQNVAKELGFPIFFTSP